MGKGMDVCFVCGEAPACCMLDGSPACARCRDRVLHNRVQNIMKVASVEAQVGMLERLLGEPE